MVVHLYSETGQKRTSAAEYRPPTSIDLALGSNERVIQIEWRRGFEGSQRKTVDWTYTVWIEARV